MVAHLGEVLVAPAGEAHEVQAVGRARILQHPGDRVGGLQRRDDPLELGHAPERRQRGVVGHGLVARAPAVAQVGVLRARARVVEAR